jgi:hypothetical protein
MYRIGDRVRVPVGDSSATLEVQRVDGIGGIVATKVVDGGHFRSDAPTSGLAAAESVGSSGKMAEFNIDVGAYIPESAIDSSHVPESMLVPVIYVAEDIDDSDMNGGGDSDTGIKDAPSTFYSHTEVVRNTDSTSVVSEFASVQETSTPLSKKQIGEQRLPFGIATVAAVAALAGAVQLSTYLFTTHRRLQWRRQMHGGQNNHIRAGAPSGLPSHLAISDGAFDAL